MTISVFYNRSQITKDKQKLYFMSFHFKTNDFSSHFSQKSLRTNIESPLPSQSLTRILNLRILKKLQPSKFTSKQPVITQYLQKSPDSHFQPGEEQKDGLHHMMQKVEPVHLTQSTRKQGPARHRNTIKLKLNLINQTDNQSENNQSNSNNLDLQKNLNNNSGPRNRARSSMAMDLMKTQSERLSLKKIRVVNKFYQDFIANVKEKKEDLNVKSRDNSEERKFRPLSSVSSRMSFKKMPNLLNKDDYLNKQSMMSSPRMRDLDVGFDICQEMKTITSNHFFNKIKEKKLSEMKENDPKKHKKAKSDVFYEDLMLSHVFETKLSDEVRERFSKFLMNDWVNKMIFERKINNPGVKNEFLDNSKEVEKVKNMIIENKTIREQFQNSIKTMNKAELFHPPNLLNRFRESIYLSQAAQVKKAYKFSNLKEYLNTKHYNERDNFYKVSQEALKNLKVKNFKKKKRRVRKFIEKERMWELRDSIMEYCRMVKELGPVFTEDFLMNGLQRIPFQSNGSYMFLSFVKKGKIAYLESMLEKNPRLIFDFDLVWLFIFCGGGGVTVIIFF